MGLGVLSPSKDGGQVTACSPPWSCPADLIRRRGGPRVDSGDEGSRPLSRVDGTDALTLEEVSE